VGSVKREGAGRGIRKGQKAVFNERIIPFTGHVKPGQVVTVVDNDHSHYVIVRLDSR